YAVRVPIQRPVARPVDLAGLRDGAEAPPRAALADRLAAPARLAALAWQDRGPVLDRTDRLIATQVALGALREPGPRAGLAADALPASSDVAAIRDGAPRPVLLVAAASDRLASAPPAPPVDEAA